VHKDRKSPFLMFGCTTADGFVYQKGYKVTREPTHLEKVEKEMRSVEGLFDVSSVIASGADLLSGVGYDPEKKEVISVAIIISLSLSSLASSLLKDGRIDDSELGKGNWNQTKNSFIIWVKYIVYFGLYPLAIVIVLLAVIKILNECTPMFLGLQEHPCRRFSLAEIQLATNNFDPETIIGKGGFGKVYKGFIDDGGTRTTVAIKRLDCLSRQGASEFWTEVKMLSRVRHGHLVSLIGYCSEFNEMMVVYEYISGGDLAKRLHKVDGKSIRTPLSWVERLKICIGAARALDYLHTGTGVKNRIIHRDVKSSNILLDENMAAKVSDLGLSKIGPVDQSCTHVSTNVKGTFGYLDPNYFMTGRLTRKSDVYSFGVVLLEVLCGRPAVDPSLDERGLVGWAQRNIKEGTLNDIIDLNMTGLTLCSRKKIQIIKAFVKIAVKCLQTRPKDRPTMSEVVVDLEAALALQERGEYLVRSRYNNGEQISSSSYSKTGKIMMLSRTLRKILPAKTPVRPDVKDGSSHGKKKNNKDGCLKKFYRTKVERVSKKLKIVPGHLAARLGCAEMKVDSWDDLAFKLNILRWNVKHNMWSELDREGRRLNVGVGLGRGVDSDSLLRDRLRVRSDSLRVLYAGVYRSSLREDGGYGLTVIKSRTGSSEVLCRMNTLSTRLDTSSDTFHDRHDTHVGVEATDRSSSD
ncbi:putative serine/threonine/dual specificity protein kinase, catalytic domain-containing protein, partial [Tanacetum coccineum]